MLYFNVHLPTRFSMDALLCRSEFTETLLMLHTFAQFLQLLFVLCLYSNVAVITMLFYSNGCIMVQYLYEFVTAQLALLFFSQTRFCIDYTTISNTDTAFEKYSQDG